ncbi:hypothetical protein BJ878DRAFT_535787 [Calycina marina]|uniref:Protein CSN12 homolog n=1 Tax=Calycina marina TaxID=1763456 RepID=A0A9P8CES2_9HELO|nr:hypothetical protein BJ878DRAFT_535787 [Calycina marina]
MDSFFKVFSAAYGGGDGYALADTLSPIAPASQPDKLRRFVHSTNYASVQNDFKYRLLYDKASPLRLNVEEGKAWVEVYVSFWKACVEILQAEAAINDNQKPSWEKVYRAWKEVSDHLNRGYTAAGFENWTVPCLYVVGKYLRMFAIKADEVASSLEQTTIDFNEDLSLDDEQHANLEDAARQLNKVFQLCLSDRASLEESRKWGIYSIINLLFKTYFKLGKITLSKNILNALRAYRGDMPELDAFPLSHQVTFKYYVGVISFLDEKYEECETCLTEAWYMCHKDSLRNKELILTYLIPCHLLTTHTLPSQALLEPYPYLQTLFSPLVRCIKQGDLSGFDAALAAGEDEFVRRRIYLTLERGRDIALRNLLRKVFIAGGFEPAKTGEGSVRRSRIRLVEFAAAVSLGSKETMETDEVECLLANMIYKNLMKGYIAREAGMVVLNKKGAFPGTGI